MHITAAAGIAVLLYLPSLRMLFKYMWDCLSNEQWRKRKGSWTGQSCPCGSQDRGCMGSEAETHLGINHPSIATSFCLRAFLMHATLSMTGGGLGEASIAYFKDASASVQSGPSALHAEVLDCFRWLHTRVNRVAHKHIHTPCINVRGRPKQITWFWQIWKGWNISYIYFSESPFVTSLVLQCSWVSIRLVRKPLWASIFMSCHQVCFSNCRGQYL